MTTTVDEIAPDIFRISTYVPQVAPPAGFTFNQILVRGAEPFLFHLGMRALFPLVSEAVRRLIPLEKLRWLSFGHVEADEMGSLALWLAAAPGAEVVHGQLGVDVSIRDLSDRPPRALADGETIDLGGKRVRFLATPHVPHNWEAGIFFEETTRTLLAGDLFSHLGKGPAVVSSEVVGPALAAEGAFHATSLGPAVGATIRRLAALKPEALALMHGSCFRGDGSAQLLGLAEGYDRLLDEARGATPGAGSKR